MLLSLALTLLGLLVVTFIIGRVMPIDPVLKIVGDRATPAQYEAARQAMGLDKPLIVQFATYMGDVLRGERTLPALLAWVVYRGFLPLALRLLVERREIVLRAVTRD